MRKLRLRSWHVVVITQNLLSSLGFLDTTLSSLHWPPLCLFHGLLLFPGCWRPQPIIVHDALFCVHSLWVIYNICRLMTAKFSIPSSDQPTHIQLPLLLASQTQHILPPTTYSLHSIPFFLTSENGVLNCSSHCCLSISTSPKPKRCPWCAFLILKGHFQPLSKSCQCYLQIIRINHLVTLL